MLTRDEINGSVVPVEASSLIPALPVDLSLKAQCCFASLHLIEMVSRGGFVCVTCFLGPTLFVCFLHTDACDSSLFPRCIALLVWRFQNTVVCHPASGHLGCFQVFVLSLWR